MIMCQRVWVLSVGILLVNLFLDFDTACGCRQMRSAETIGSSVRVASLNGFDDDLNARYHNLTNNNICKLEITKAFPPRRWMMAEDGNSHAPAAGQSFPADEQDGSADGAAHQAAHQTYYIGSYGDQEPPPYRPSVHDTHSQQSSTGDETTYWLNTASHQYAQNAEESHSPLPHQQQQQGYGRPPHHWDALYDRMAMMNYPADAAAAAAAASMQQYQYPHHADPYAMHRSHDFVPPMYPGYHHHHPGAATPYDSASSNPYHQPPPDPEAIGRYGYPIAAEAASGDFHPPFAYGGGGYRAPTEQENFSEQQQHQYQQKTTAATNSSIYQASNNRGKTFPQKLLQALVELENEEAVAWLPDGTSFVILNQELFIAEVLNKHFKASKYASFIRKLHRWGFLRLTSGTGADCFHHPMFAKDNPENAAFITCTTHQSKASAEIKKSRSKPSLPGVERFIRSKLAALSSSVSKQRPDDSKPAAAAVQVESLPATNESPVPHHHGYSSTRESTLKREEEEDHPATSAR